MTPLSFDLVPDRRRARSLPRRRGDADFPHGRTEDGFLCKQCNAFVSSASFLSGVQNRNHCPYCLWSRHLDLYEAGDRLSACKAPMKPIALTVKATRNKYGSGRGELMLIHLCIDCGRPSLNRIAADDDSQKIFSVFVESSRLDVSMRTRLAADGIRVLDARDEELIRVQLFGQCVVMA